MCITITVGERGRKLMGTSTTVINCVIIALSMALFVAGVGIRVRIDKRLEILGDYDPGALPYYLMVTASLLFLVHLVAVWFCHSATYVETRSDQHHYFVALILALLALFLVVVASEIVMLVHSSLIYGALEDGIGDSMKAYKSDLYSKIRMDRLQLQFECCGIHSHKDWFKISWVSTMYINVLSPEVKPYLIDGEFIKDDVPFSCCSRHAKRACVHHSVGRFSQHEGISGSSLNQHGCATAIYKEFNSVLLAPTMWLLFVILVLQAVAIVVMRLLQTSIFTADEMNDPEGDTEAYCIRGWGGGGDTRDLFKRRKSKDRDAEKGKGKDDDDDEDDDRKKSRKKKGFFSRFRKKSADDDDDEDGDDEDGDDDDDEDDDDDDQQKRRGIKSFFSKFKRNKDGDEDDDDDDKKKKKKGKTDKKKEKEKKVKEKDEKKKNKKKDEKKKKKKKDEKKKKKEEKKKKAKKKEEKKKKAKKEAEKKKKKAKKKAEKKKKKDAKKKKQKAKKAKKKAKKTKSKKSKKK